MRLKVWEQHLYGSEVSLGFSRPWIFNFSHHNLLLNLFFYLRNLLEEYGLKMVGCAGRIKHTAFGFEKFAAEKTFFFHLVFKIIYLSLFPGSLVQSEVIVDLASNNFITQAKTAHLVEEVLDFDMGKLFQWLGWPVNQRRFLFQKLDFSSYWVVLELPSMFFV